MSEEPKQIEIPPTEYKGTEKTEEHLDEKEDDISVTDSLTEKNTPQSIEDVCDNMLEKVVAYFNGELTATCEDYKLLEKLNNMTSSKYGDLSSKAVKLTENMISLNEKYKALQPFLEQIDYLEQGVQKLEAAAYQLDACSKQLEAKFKKMDKK